MRLPAFREGLREQTTNPQYATLSFEERLLLLVELEYTRRTDKRFQRRMKLAEFPMQATIEDLDFSPERGLDRRLVLELAQCNWVEKALNILILGATGTGKSFLACSLGVAGCRLGYTVRYLRTSRFLHALNRARQDGSRVGRSDAGPGNRYAAHPGRYRAGLPRRLLAGQADVA